MVWLQTKCKLLESIFGSKWYILKESRKGKFDVKSDEGIFLGYSTKRKAYKCLNSNTNKVVESVNVKIDEFVERRDTACKEEPKDYSTFIYVDDDASNTQNEQENQVAISQQIGNDVVQQIVEKKRVGAKQYIEDVKS